MSFDDNNITAAVRRILASYWIDLTRLNIRTTRGFIHISGYLQRTTYEHAEMDEKILRLVDTDLRLLDKVRNVDYDLDNWDRNDMEVWRRVDPKDKKRHKAPLWEPVE